jgi:lysozyme
MRVAAIIIIAAIIIAWVGSRQSEESMIIDHPAIDRFMPRYYRPYHELQSGDEIIIAAHMIKRWEGFSHTPYKCAAGVDTIGYGETDPNIVGLGYISEADASKLLIERLESIRYEINYHLEVPINKNKMAALISFQYNLGGSNCKNISNRINQGKLDEAAEAIMLYDKCKGKPLKGLKRRRLEEHQLFIL